MFHRQRRRRRRSKQTALSQGSKGHVRVNPRHIYMPPPPPKREYDPCPLSGEPIDNIYIAIADPDTSKPARFDRVIDFLKKRERINSSQRLVYIGAGNFGIVEDIQKRGRRVIRLMKTISYEKQNQNFLWRRELSSGISRDYVPSPQSLSDLYSVEELKSFPQFNAHTVHSRI